MTSTPPRLIATAPAGDDATAGFTPVDLYQRREKIFTRTIQGRFQRIRMYSGWPLLLGYMLLPWVNWGSRQAVLFDLPSRQFYVFGITSRHGVPGADRGDYHKAAYPFAVATTFPRTFVIE